MANIKGFTLKGVNYWEGRNATGAQGTLYYQGKKVGWYNDEGRGAEIDFYFDGEKRREYEDLLARAVREYYADRCPYPEFPELTGNQDTFMCELTDLIESEKEYKKMARQGYPIVVFYKNEKGEYCVLGVKNEAALDKYLAVLKYSQLQIFKSPADFDIK